MIVYIQASLTFDRAGGSYSTPVEAIRDLDADVLRFVAEHERELSAAATAYLYITIEFQDECAFAFEPSTLAALGARRLDLWVSCWT